MLISGDHDLLLLIMLIGGDHDILLLMGDHHSHLLLINHHDLLLLLLIGQHGLLLSRRHGDCERRVADKDGYITAKQCERNPEVTRRRLHVHTNR